MLEVANPPLADACREETEREADAFLEEWNRIGTGACAYIEQRDFLRRLIQWGKADRETREEVVKVVIRELSGRGDVLFQLQNILG